MPKESISNMENLEDVIEYKALNPSQAIFSIGDNGFLQLCYQGEHYNKVSLIRLLPFHQPDRYISCVHKDTEIGIITAITDFPPDQQKIIREQLNFRYFAPVIEKIISAKEKMWFLYLKIVVSGCEKEICISDLYNNIKAQDKESVILTDIEGNRYKIENFSKLDSKSRQRIEVYL